jgi:regulator of cell morphogenesis and NO signaling
MINTSKTVAEYAIEYPSSKRVFEKLKIDYCCGGKISLSQACAKNNVSISELSALLESEDERSTSADFEPDHAAMSLASLADHIVRKHHLFTRDENERIATLLEKVCKVHGSHNPKLYEIEMIFGTMRLELENHMLKEERMLFPYISLMESSLNFGLAVPPAPFGTTRNPVRVMTTEHEAAGEQLRKIRELAEDFQPPEWACATYRALLEALEGIEKDLFRHIHLENNILFPKAIEMEERGEVYGARISQEAVCGHQNAV